MYEMPGQDRLLASEDGHEFGDNKMGLGQVLPFLLCTSLLLGTRHFPMPRNFPDSKSTVSGHMDAYHFSR